MQYNKGIKPVCFKPCGEKRSLLLDLVTSVLLVLNRSTPEGKYGVLQLLKDLAIFN